MKLVGGQRFDRNFKGKGSNLEKKHDDRFSGFRVRILRRRDRNLSAPEKTSGPLDGPVKVLVAVGDRPRISFDLKVHWLRFFVVLACH